MPEEEKIIPLSDAKTEDTSSQSSDANTQVDSSATIDAKTNEAPPEPKKDFADLALDEFNKQQAKAAADSSPAPTDTKEGEPSPGDIKKSNATEEKPVDFSDLPFHKHPRFQELLRERETLKTTAESAKPHVERLAVIEKYRQSHRISDDQFKNGMEIMALVNTDPEAALQRLEPLYRQLQEFKGQVLPEDLKKEVDDGMLPLNRAQELAALRRKGDFQQRQSQVTAQERQTEALINTINSWETTVRRTDADFERKAQAVRDRFVALSASNKWQTPEDAVQLMDRAYKEVNAWIGEIVPKPRPIKSPPKSGLSSRTKAEFKSWNDVEEAMVHHYATNGSR